MSFDFVKQFKDKPVLVTGADGFIGSHLSERLVREGARVRALACYNSFNSWGWLDTIAPEVRDKLEVIPGDIRDPHGVAKLVDGVHTIFHLAALIGIPYSYHSPDSYVDVNVKGTLNILQAAREQQTERVLVTSTSEVYGTALYAPIDEKHPRQGQSPYSATKIGADSMAEAYFRSFEVPVTIVRPFNTYGPRQSARAVIPTIIAQLLDNRKDIRLGSLTPTRDLVFVKDTVEGFLRIAGCEQAIGQELNIATGVEISIGDLADTLIRLIAPDAKIVSDDDRKRPAKSEVERLLGSAAKLEEYTGWKPGTSLEDGLGQTINWFRAWFESEANRKSYKSHLYTV